MNSRTTALILLLAIAAALPFGAAEAARRVYLYPGKVGQFVPKLIDGLADHGFRFSVGRVYNYEKDGKEGFVFEMKPARTLCEITFTDREGRSVVTLFTQDPSDIERIGLFFIRSLGMTEAGLPPEREAPTKETWPLPGR